MIKIAGTFDIECAEWDQFSVGCTYEDEGQHRVWYNGREMIDYMRSRGGVWWGHAAGIYDTIWVARDLTQRGISYQADESDHRITRLVCGSLQLRDSFALWPAPLDDLAGALGVEVPSLPWACVCGHDCGGYCQIGSRANEGDPDLEAYVTADCRVLYHALHYLQATAREHGIELRGTLASTAWQTAKASLVLPDAELPWRTWRHLRAADKGGRLAIVRIGAEGPGNHWDMINAYPSALAEMTLPCGAHREVGAKEAHAAYVNERPGVYTARVTVPEDSFLPPLPWRHGGRILYPTGTFDGTWARIELEAAEARGITIDEIHSAVVFEDELPIFETLMRQWYAIRRAVGRHSPIGQVFSRMAKSLTGKFTEDPCRARIMANPQKIKLCPRTGSCRERCSKRCGRYEQLDLWGAIWSAPYWHMGESAHVQWSVYLRAHTRLRWLQQAERFGTALVYGNTDSLWTLGRKRPTPIGDELGHWELKNTWANWTCRAPNVYRFDDAHKGAQIVAAGTHSKISDADWSRGGGILTAGVESFRQGARNTAGLFKRKHRRWTLPDHSSDGVYGDRKLDAVSGITYPMDAKEHRERHGNRAHPKTERPQPSLRPT